MSIKEKCNTYQKEVDGEVVLERYMLIMERIQGIKEEKTTKEPFSSYFQKTAEFIMQMHEIQRAVEDHSFFEWSLERHKECNRIMYEDIEPRQYPLSYANPAYAVQKLGEGYGKLLSFLSTELRKMTGYAVEGRVYEMTIYSELFVEIYNCFEDGEGTTPEGIQKIIYWFFHDYSEVFAPIALSRMLNPEEDFFTRIIMDSDFEDLRYLYHYGCHIGENELKMAEFLNRMPQEQIQAMADTYTEGYRIGFEVMRKDLSKKTTVELRYPIGFERMMRAAIHNFEKLGLRPTIRRGHMGVDATSVNEQYDYDHKSDAAAFLDKAYVERYLECMRSSFEDFKELAAGFAGPAVVEVFGKEPFTPASKPENYQYNEKQQKLNVYQSNMAGQITNQYIKGEERSFTIIAYPIPEIGEKFEEIFEKTVEINNLDYTLYQQMQQKIIDVLDQADTVHIRGAGENRTDLTVAIYPLQDPEKETAFENCVADVNIPVGEVFTTPVLKGTNGILHVGQVFLKQLKYLDLELKFEDGMIVEYHCKNFVKEEENQAFLKENLLHHHDTLPIGEFAIGTNTTAYKMGRDYKIQEKLPILIAEKTGPHFAVGDSCYSWAEDNPVFNQDGKEIVARDNEISILRKEDMEKAYFNCHTDITIPYDELDKITVIKKDGSRQDIISCGRFVLEGTERLNEPFLEKE